MVASWRSIDPAARIVRALTQSRRVAAPTVPLCHDAEVGIGRHDVLRVSTSDNVGIGYDIAGLGSRFIAQLLDSLIVAVIALIADTAVISAVNGSDPQNVGLATLAAAGVTLFVYIGYFTVCEVATGGRTPGNPPASCASSTSLAPRPPPVSSCSATWHGSLTSCSGWAWW